MTTRLRLRLPDGQVFDVDAEKADALYPDTEIVAAFERDGDRLIPVDRPAKRTAGGQTAAKARKPRKIERTPEPAAAIADAPAGSE